MWRLGVVGVVGGVENFRLLDEEELRVPEETGKLMPLSSLSASLSETVYGRALWSQQGFSFFFSCFSTCGVRMLR